MKTSNKILITDAAKKLFALKGFSETKISDISRAVGISDGAIYEHFENKMDILLSIPREKTEEFNSTNKQNMRGLAGPATVKLRKLVWNYIELLADDLDYANIILFELRTNRAFYKTEGYQLIRKTADVYRETIIEGKEAGQFNPDISNFLILNLIFGTIDHVFISRLIENKPIIPLDIFDELYELIENAIIYRRTMPPKKGKRHLIENAAVQLFSHSGFEKTRIQDITKLAGISDATFYKYFQSKEDILFSLPAAYTSDFISDQEEYMKGIKSSDLKLKVLIKNYLDHIQSQKAYSAIILFELRYNKLFYNTETYNIFRRFARLYYDAIVDGIEKKQFRASLNPYLATKMIFGLIDHTFLSSNLFGKPEKITDLTDSICNLILGAFKE
ncbi:TetR/AcrR family transcriptional regulator [Thermodesulfobacteriota bacterium]